MDLCECSGDLVGLILLALLARQHGELAGEQELLQHAHDTDSGAFWIAVQSVYRFVRPLHEICGAVSPIMPADHLQQPLSSHRVVFYPDYSRSNAYQDLLYRPLREAGGRVYGTSDEDELLSLAPLKGYRNVLHVHWVNRLFKPDDSACRYQTIPRAEAFLGGLARQKQRGFALYWTIHNQLSHESCDPATEKVFRQDLYRLADRVFIHHPLIRSLLDWLPDDHKLCLCEHGNYGVDVVSELPRCAARQALGLQPDDFVVTHLGQIRDYKALDNHLPVLFGQLARFPHMRLLIAGRVSSPGTRRWLLDNRHSRATVRDVFLSDDELACYMRATDVGFLSYGTTLTSGTLFHWLTCGCPVLAPASGTIPAYILDGWNGFTYRDTASLERLLAGFLTLPREELARLARNAQTTAAQLRWRMWNGDTGC
jgi:glycosyltransferase involved in cell wall biosynthesis